MLLDCVCVPVGGVGDCHPSVCGASDPAGPGGHTPWSLAGRQVLPGAQMGQAP